MAAAGLYEAAFPFADDVLALPVEDIDRTAEWYGPRFGLVEVERRDSPVPTVILERDGEKFQVRDELEANGVNTANWRVDERDGEKFQVFFVVAPDGLCYYFHQPIGRAVA